MESPTYYVSSEYLCRRANFSCNNEEAGLHLWAVSTWLPGSTLQHTLEQSYTDCQCIALKCCQREARYLIRVTYETSQYLSLLNPNISFNPLQSSPFGRKGTKNEYTTLSLTFSGWNNLMGASWDSASGFIKKWLKTRQGGGAGIHESEGVERNKQKQWMPGIDRYPGPKLHGSPAKWIVL